MALGLYATRVREDRSELGCVDCHILRLSGDKLEELDLGPRGSTTKRYILKEICHMAINNSISRLIFSIFSIIDNLVCVSLHIGMRAVCIVLCV